MTTSSVVLGGHVFAFRSGTAFTVPSSGTASATAKPGGADTGWIDLGIVESITVEATGDEKEIFAPSPGRLRLVDVLRVKDKLKFTFELSQMSPLVWQLIFRTLNLSAGAGVQYNPLEGAEVKAWLKIEQYDQTDAAWNTVDVFCYLNISGGTKFGDDVVKPTVEATVLHSTLNTGSLT